MTLGNRLLALLLGILVAWPISAQEQVPSDDFSSLSGQPIWRGASQFLLSQVRVTLEGIHPASLARRGRQPGLTLEEGWQSAPRNRNLVIAVHGFYSNRDRTAALLAGPREAGFPIGCFEYASNKPIEDSARLLSESLRKVASQQPDRKISLLTHSLGGVVARAVVEDPELDPGNVAQLIMIAPPNHGSGLANLVQESRENLDADEPEGLVAVRLSQKLLYAAIGPAAKQLQLNSSFLSELNGRPRNPAVEYAIFLGDKAPLPAGTDVFRYTSVEETDRAWRWTRWAGNGVKQRLANLSEIRKGEGDGVVSIASGRIEGVDDVVILHFHHNEPLWDPDEPVVQELYREVMKRLAPERTGE